jgi:predicted permease
VALTLGGLLLHSLLNLETMPVGFDRDHVLALDMSGNAAGHNDQAINSFYDRLLEKVNALPGVRSATLSSFAPVSGSGFGVNLRVEGYTLRSGEEPKAFLNAVRPGYFSTLGIERLEGRDFTLHDSPASPPVAIVDRSLAQHYFSQEDPVGKRIEIVGDDRPLEIVGVVADSKYGDLREPPTDLIYVASLQGISGPPAIRSTLSVRAPGNLAGLRNTLPEVIHSLDASVHVTWIATLGERIDNSLHADRLTAALCAAFSLVALVLTCVGLYGLLSFRVARSSREIGVRMALGAERARIFRLFVARGMRLALVGLLIGASASLASASLLKSLLFGVDSADPVTMIAICMLLALAAFTVCFLPARRATRVTPMVALRQD